MKFLSIDEAAETLAISRATCQRLIDRGNLPAITIAAGQRKRLQRIDEADLQAFVQNLKNKGSKKNDRLRLATNS